MENPNRHGGPYDRGSADAYYRRPRIPHYYKDKTYLSEEVTELTAEEIKEYNAGYSKQVESGDFKNWN